MSAPNHSRAGQQGSTASSCWSGDRVRDDEETLKSTSDIIGQKNQRIIVNPSIRTSHRRRASFGLAVVASLSLMAACGSDGGGAAATTQAPAPETTAAPTTVEMMDNAPFGPACGAVPMEGAGSFDGMAKDPAATAASNNPLLSTLVTAVKAAGLVDTLNGDGPFTIFAPTNDAFAKIPADQLKAILADKEMLTKILTYHVVAGTQYDAAGLGKAGELDSVEGEKISFGADGTMVNDAKVLCSNVMTANATVHIVDTVLLPPSLSEPMGMALEPTGPGCAAVPADGAGSFAGMAKDPAATAASNNPLLSTLVTAVTKAGLVDTLNGDGPFTIFAPVNDAFAAIPADQLEAILADNDMLTKILTYHVIAGEQLSSADLIKAGKATTVNGAELTFGDDMGQLTVNGAKTLCMDVPTANATVHIIDTVLVP
jgi:uncharacterized surface protein with fasciclin (FAS1) repeats